jgi:transposase
MPMPDREISTAGAPGSGMPCRYCAAGQDAVCEPDGAEPGMLAHLYVCRGLSTYRIAERTGLGRQKVTRMLRRAGVPLRPRGAGRLRPPRRADPPGLPQLLGELYTGRRLSSEEIGALLGMPGRTVRDRLRRYGIAARTRGGWNREDRRIVPAPVLADLYTRQGMTADQVGRRMGASRSTVLRSAHAFGVPGPLRRGRPTARPRGDRAGQRLVRRPVDCRGPRRARHSPRPARRPGLGEVPQPGAADHSAGQGPVLGMRRRTQPHRTAHRAACDDRARVHAPRRDPAAPSRRADPFPAPLAAGCRVSRGWRGCKIRITAMELAGFAPVADGSCLYA